MNIISVFKKNGVRAYLWSKGNYQYALGTVSTNFHTWDGYTLDEVLEQISGRGWKLNDS